MSVKTLRYGHGTPYMNLSLTLSKSSQMQHNSLKQLSLNENIIFFNNFFKKQKPNRKGSHVI